MDAIAVDGLEKTYGKDIRALDGVSFSVREGEIFGLLGPKGTAHGWALTRRPAPRLNRGSRNDRIFPPGGRSPR